MPAKAALTSRNNPALRELGQPKKRFDETFSADTVLMDTFFPDEAKPEAKPAGVSDRVGTLLEIIALVVFLGGIAMVVIALSGS